MPTTEAFERNGIPHLKSQFAQATPILLTGAGFSSHCRNPSGGDLPSGRQLAERLWELCFPGTPVESDTSLQDVYQEALLRRRDDLRQLLRNELSVASASLKPW